MHLHSYRHEKLLQQLKTLFSSLLSAFEIEKSFCASENKHFLKTFFCEIQVLLV